MRKPFLYTARTKGSLPESDFAGEDTGSTLSRTIAVENTLSGSVPGEAILDGPDFIRREKGVLFHGSSSLRHVQWNTQRSLRRRRRLQTTEDAQISAAEHSRHITDNELQFISTETTQQGDDEFQILQSICKCCEKVLESDNELEKHLQTCYTSRSALLTVRAATLASKLIGEGST